MSDLEAIADRVEIEALRGEFADAAMMRDYGRDQIRAWGERVPEFVEYFVQNTHPGVIRLDGGTASGRAYMSELIRLRDGSSHLNYAIYHDRYQRTGDGWKFTERVYEIRYLDTAPLTGSVPGS
jgi:SnoaL-like protein